MSGCWTNIKKNPKDPAIRDRLNTCRFADFKEQGVDFLAPGVTESLETVKITEAVKHLSHM